MQIVVSGENPKLGLFSGIHGDEWRIIPSVRKIIQKHQSELKSFVFIPECSPSAVSLKTRKNEDGLDLNRSFTKNPKSKEAQDIINALQPFTFDLCVDFHEDVDLEGVYIYDSENIEGTEILESFRNQVKAVAPLHSGMDDDNDAQLQGNVHEGYRVSHPPQKDGDGNHIYEGFFDFWALIEGKTKRWMTLEVPTGLTQTQKEAVIDIFFQTFIK